MRRGRQGDGDIERVGDAVVSAKAPAFQFYPMDFLTDEKVVLMSNTEVGIYVRLLCFCWLEGSLPLETDSLARMARVPLKQFTKLWERSVVRTCFQVTEDGRLQHKRLEKERAKQETFRRRASDGGKAALDRREASGRFGPASTRVAGEVSTRVAGASDGIVAGELTSSSSSSSSSSASSEGTSTNKLREREKSASLSPPADPFVNPQTTERAGRFLDRYELLYVKHRKGARYARKPMRDYAAAVTLCDTWADDTRLDKLATIFLTTDHKFAEEGSRTVPQFLALASWCDGKLAEHEAKARPA